MIKNKDTDYAWAAGFLDADGSFSLINCTSRKGKPCNEFRPVVQVTQVKMNNILKLMEITNGCSKVPWKGKMVYRGTNGRTPRMYYKHAILGKKRLLPFLTSILPYMVSKKRQCKYLLRVVGIKRDGGRDNHIYTERQKNFFKYSKEMIMKLNANTRGKKKLDPK